MYHFQALLVAYLIWGLSPLYWRVLGDLSPIVIVCFRMIGALALLLIASFLRGKVRDIFEHLKNRRLLMLSIITSALVAINWSIFLYAIDIGRTVEASLGYYILPLVTVLCGRVFFQEHLNRAQVVALITASIGVLLSTIDYGTVPWYSLSLALTFAVYTMIHKVIGRYKASSKDDTITPLLVEFTLLSPFAALFILSQSSDLAAASQTEWLFLLGAGLMTATPLFLLCSAIKKVPLVFIGFVQFVAPTLQLIVAVEAFGEPFTKTQGAAFSFIWAGIAIFLIDKWWGVTVQNRRALAK